MVGNSHPVFLFMERFEDDNPQNIYVIRRKLSNYKMLPNEEEWALPIGRFWLQISLTQEDFWRVTNNLGNRKAVLDCKILDFQKFDVRLFEHDRITNPTTRDYVYLEQDPRFKNYEPIQYNILETPSGARINQSNGKEMPLLHLMELIRLLHRLSNLTAFT